MAKRRLTKDELEKDQLVERYEQLEDYYAENKNTVLWSAVAVILLIGLGIGYYYYSVTQEQQAQVLMANAEQYYMNGNFQTALRGSEQDFTVGFEQIASNYSRTDAGNLAHYYAAVCEFNLGNIEQALSYMGEFDVPEGIMGVGPLSFHGVILTELGEHTRAAERYLQAAHWDQNDSTTPYNLLEAAHAFHDAGDRNKAIRYSRQVVEEFPNSDQVTEARQLIGLLAAQSNS